MTRNFILQRIEFLQIELYGDDHDFWEVGVYKQMSNILTS